MHRLRGRHVGCREHGAVLVRSATGVADGIQLRRTPMRDRARRLIEAYRVKTPGPDAAIKGLSGGNVQRAVLARELSSEGDLLIVANPCFGLDFAAVAEIGSCSFRTASW